MATAARRHWTIEQLEARYIREILRQTRGNYSRAAAILGMTRGCLRNKVRQLNIGISRTVATHNTDDKKDALPV